MDLRLRDRTVLVTGGSAGVGLATVAALAGDGANVVVCARDGELLRQALGLTVPGARVLARAADVRDPRAMASLVDEAVSTFGGLDALVLNAGEGRRGDLASTTDDEWRAEFEMKIFGVLHPLRAAMPHLERSSAARVVIVNAVIARKPETTMIAVGTARAALLNMTRALATELAPAEILVNSVALGLIDSRLHEARYQREKPDVDYREWLASIARDRGVPLGRAGLPEEVAPVIALLASPLASFITGATVDVAGGGGGYV